MSTVNIYLGCSLEAMKSMKDNEYDLAVVDPPYFSAFGKENYTGSDYSTTGIKRQHKKSIHWEIPSDLYFKELLRVSKNQIVWGVNYYAQYIPHVGRIVWDKKNDTSTFSKCEIASHSFGVRVDMFRYTWNGMIQEDMKNKENRIHPCQKPVALYQWIYEKYSKPGMKILDTHLGSGSSAIAAWDMGLDFDGWELDAEYHANALSRFQEHTRQGKLF